ncbi:hypothetical protein [Trichocoleus sp. FACHB-40]|nr:hypothetical protein [Trichocoleus sp. FACHB-40]
MRRTIIALRDSSGYGFRPRTTLAGCFPQSQCAIAIAFAQSK